LGWGWAWAIWRPGLVDFEVGHFELAEEIEEHGVLFGSEIADGFFAEGIEHIDEFVGGFGIYNGLAGARVGVGAENHGGIAADHADEILEGGTFLGVSLGERRAAGARLFPWLP